MMLASLTPPTPPGSAVKTERNNTYRFLLTRGSQISGCCQGNATLLWLCWHWPSQKPGTRTTLWVHLTFCVHVCGLFLCQMNGLASVCFISAEIFPGHLGKLRTNTESRGKLQDKASQEFVFSPIIYTVSAFQVANINYPDQPKFSRKKRKKNLGMKGEAIQKYQKLIMLFSSCRWPVWPSFMFLMTNTAFLHGFSFSTFSPHKGTCMS